MTGTQNEQRRFQRIHFRCTVTLALADDIWQLELEDLSLKGARFRKPPTWQVEPGSEGQLSLELADSNTITMAVIVDHCERTRLGVHWTEIDVDSLAHLRRLMELNSGNAGAIGRELGTLES